MAVSDHKIIIELFCSDNKMLYRGLVKQPDWLPALEASKFALLRTGNGVSVSEKIVPNWNPGLGQPYVSSFSAIAESESGAQSSVEIPITYFRNVAQIIGEDLVDASVLFNGEQFVYTIKAYPVSPDATPAISALSLSIDHVNASPVHGQRNITDFTDIDNESAGVGDHPFPIFVPRQVLDTASALKDSAGQNETGGLLIGHLWQDPISHQLFVEVTAFLLARHTTAASTRLTFTPDTWADVHAAITLRQRDESLVGWLHTHPSRYWCQSDVVSESLNTHLTGQFFSSTDCHLHRTIFYSAYQVGIVLGDQYAPETGWTTNYSAFGWEGGVIQSRSFYVMDSQPGCESVLERKENWQTAPALVTQA